jgi:hypothetical protein
MDDNFKILVDLKQTHVEAYVFKFLNLAGVYINN